MTEIIKQNEDFTDSCLRLFEAFVGNQVELPEGRKVTLYDAPLIGFAAAEDAIFTGFKAADAIGEGFYLPKEWLPSGKTVAAFFFPFSEVVRTSNRADAELPSTEWLYARIEGQEFLDRYMKQVELWLKQCGVEACVPSLDSRFQVQRIPQAEKGFHAQSRWSERHAAYACGLGTFGLSRGLITEKGMAGRIASIILDVELTPTVRPYTGLYEYCSGCGACAVRCPVGAISREQGKNNAICSDFLDEMGEKFAPRYGCGKCQTRVPCEYRAPGKK